MEKEFVFKANIRANEQFSFGDFALVKVSLREGIASLREGKVINCQYSEEDTEEQKMGIELIAGVDCEFKNWIGFRIQSATSTDYGRGMVEIDLNVVPLHDRQSVFGNPEYRWNYQSPELRRYRRLSFCRPEDRKKIQAEIDQPGYNDYVTQENFRVTQWGGVQHRHPGKPWWHPIGKD